MTTKQELFRDALFDRQSIDMERRTVALAFASEMPVERFGYREILDCAPTSVRLERLTDGGALLVDHEWKDQVGVVESVSFGADRVGRAVVRFGKGARASEIFTDVVDGIRTKVSFGYWIHEYKTSKAADGIEEIRASLWEPFEISLVSVPADHSVGVGRSAEEPVSIIVKEEPKMENQNPAPVDTAAIERDVRARELSRINALEAMGKTYARFGGEDLARAAISEGKTVGDLQAAILERVKAAPVPSSDIGLTQAEVRQFSFMRAINALSNPTDRHARAAAAYEFEVSEAAAKVSGKQARGIMVPSDVLKANLRDLTAGTPADGGRLVATDLLASSFIDLLRNRSIVRAAGATMLSGLNGNVAIPKQSGGATAFWVAENSAPTESQQTFAQVTLSPKTVGAFTDISRRLMLQSSIDVEALVRTDLATVLAIEIDRAALHGSGASNQPTGIAATSGIGSVAGGTNGLQPTWGNIVQLETEVGIDNALVASCGYITNSRIVGRLKQTSRVSGQNGFIWEGSGTDSTMNGYNAWVSNQVASNLTKGTSNGICSAIFFGNWSDLMIGMWGGLDLTVDPYSGSTAGTVRVVALQDVDVAVRNAESFAAMLDALQ